EAGRDCLDRSRPRRQRAGEAIESLGRPRGDSAAVGAVDVGAVASAPEALTEQRSEQDAAKVAARGGPSVARPSRASKLSYMEPRDNDEFDPAGSPGGPDSDDAFARG